MVTLRDDLAVLGEVITDQDFAITLATSLPLTFNTFLSAIELKTITTESLTMRLIKEERRRNKSDSSDTVMAAQKRKEKSKNSNKKTDRTEITCYGCNETGHIKRDCPKRKKKKKQANG